MNLTNQQVARAGEHYVVAEINRRGGYAACFGGNMPQIDILATDRNHEKAVTIQVKAKTSRDWQTSISKGQPRSRELRPIRFWILVDLSVYVPRYFVMPEWWITNDIFEAHEEFLGSHLGSRPRSPDSTHHAIRAARVEKWHDRWDILRIFHRSEP